MKTWKKSLVIAGLLMFAAVLSACGSTNMKGNVILDDVPQRNVLVSLESQNDGASNAKMNTRTGDEGQYSFSDIEPGEYFLTIRLDGSGFSCFFMQEGLKVARGRTLTVNLDVESKDLTGSMLQFVDDFLMSCMVN
jgi:hypothetical protein